MKLVTANLADIKRIYKPTKYLEMLNSFMDNHMQVAEIIPEEGETVKAQQMATAIRSAIKRFGFTCKVVTRSNRVYLVAHDVEV